MKSGGIQNHVMLVAVLQVLGSLVFTLECCCSCGRANYCTHRCMKDDKGAHTQSSECSLLQIDAARLAFVLTKQLAALRLVPDTSHNGSACCCDGVN